MPINNLTTFNPIIICFIFKNIIVFIKKIKFIIDNPINAEYYLFINQTNADYGCIYFFLHAKSANIGF